MEFKLWEKETPYFEMEYGQPEPTLTFYPADGKDRPCVIVCPGGGYNHRAQHEGEPVAEWLASIGISAFVLNYRFAPYRYKAIMSDIARAIRLVRYKSKELSIDKNKVGVLGFSAGGHLASSLTVHFKDFDAEKPLDEIDKEPTRPDTAILCYSVISSDKKIWHKGSFENLLGDDFENMSMRDYYSNDKHVTADTPPTFLWHTAEDKGVSPENSLRFAIALKQNDVPFEIHIYPEGPHGLGLGKNIVRVHDWIIDCEKWFNTIGFIK